MTRQIMVQRKGILGAGEVDIGLLQDKFLDKTRLLFGTGEVDLWSKQDKLEVDIGSSQDQI
jgi:hypothetical protein